MILDHEAVPHEKESCRLAPPDSPTDTRELRRRLVQQAQPSPENTGQPMGTAAQCLGATLETAIRVWSPKAR